MPFPRAVYSNVFEIMPDFNELVHKVSLDSEFLNEHLQPAAKTDEFQRRLLDIYNSCCKEGIAQVCVRMCVYVCMYVRRACVCVYVCVCRRARAHARIRGRACACKCKCVRVRVCVCVCKQYKLY